MWMLMSLFIALPACLVAYINAKKRDEAEHHHPRQEFVAYPHLRMRTKVLVVFVTKCQFIWLSSVFAVAIFSAKSWKQKEIWPRALLATDKKFHTGCRLLLVLIILNDLEWS